MISTMYAWLVEKIIQKINNPFIFKDWHHDFYIQRPTDRIAYNVKRKAVSFSKNVTRFVDKIVKPDWVCLDIGACKGAISIAMLKKVSKGQVYSIEADPNNINLIKTNLLLNNFSPDKVYNYAVQTKNTPVKLTVFPGKNGRQTIATPKDLKPGYPKPVVVKVPGISLDKFCYQQKIKHINLLKIDTEGAELEILKSAKKLIQQEKIDIIIFEVEPKLLGWLKTTPEDIYKILKRHQYTIAFIDDNGKLTPISERGDAVAYKNKQLIKQAL